MTRSPDPARQLDWAAVQTNLLASVLILLTGGLCLAVMFIHVFRRAGATFTKPSRIDWILVCGKALRGEAPTPDFRIRLQCALRLARANPRSQILILGGRKEGVRLSEAEAGAQYLIRRGVMRERIALEDQSLNTLENMQQATRHLGEAGRGNLVLVTSRHHLARSCAMAHNLGLMATGCPAEPRRAVSVLFFRRVLWEAYLMHWYVVGLTYARLTGQAAMLARVHPSPSQDG